MSQEHSHASEKDLEYDFAFVVRLTCLAILITLYSEWRNFLPGFRHPLLTLIPLYEPLATLPSSVDWGIFFLCITLLIWLFITPQKRLPAFGISACIIFWGLQDIVRFQPWFHMYCFVILVAAFCKNPKNGLDALRIMICGVYFWAGFHKINLTFVTKIMPWFLAPFYTPSLDWLFKLAAFTAPLFEAAIGVLLIFRQWRRVATVMAFMMMMVVLACLGPFGRNWKIVIPLWNVWLFLMELRLFMSPAYHEAVSLLHLKLQRLSLLSFISIVMFVMAPAMAIFVPWYARLGFKVFAGNTLDAEIILSPNETLAQRPELFQGMIKGNDRLSLKIPIYHSTYAYRMRSEAVTPYLDYPSEAILRIYSPPPFYSTEREYIDQQLPKKSEGVVPKQAS